MALPAAIAITISIMAAISWESFPRRFLIAFVAVSVAGGVRIMRAHHATRPASRSLQLCSCGSCGSCNYSRTHIRSCSRSCCCCWCAKRAAVILQQTIVDHEALMLTCHKLVAIKVWSSCGSSPLSGGHKTRADSSAASVKMPVRKPPTTHVEADHQPSSCCCNCCLCCRCCCCCCCGMCQNCRVDLWSFAFSFFTYVSCCFLGARQ